MDYRYIYQTVKLYKHDDDGTFAYTDTYGDRHEFDSAEAVWDHLTEDGEEWSEEIKSFIFEEESVTL